MKHFTILIIMLLLVGCQSVQPAHTDKVEVEGVEETKVTYEFTSGDEEVRFVVLNLAGHDDEFLSKLETSILSAYDQIRNEMTKLSTYSEVTITLNEDAGDLITTRESNIYIPVDSDLDQYDETYWIMDLTSALSKLTYGDGAAFLLEGLQYYLAEQYGESLLPKNMTYNHLLKYNYKIQELPYQPLKDLVDNNTYKELYTDDEFNLMIMVEAASFTSYFIDHYGFDTFAEIYQSDELYDK